MYWCWSRHDKTNDELENLTISIGVHTYDNAEVNDMINRPFTARFYVNETHITCQENEEWSGKKITDKITYVHCPTIGQLVFLSQDLTMITTGTICNFLFVLYFDIQFRQGPTVCSTYFFLQ